MDKRGSRRKNSARKQRAARAAADKPQGRLQRWTRRLLVWGGAIALLGALFIALAVAFAARSMPSYYQLKATQTAQLTFGGFGYAKEYHVERLVREAILFRIAPVTPQLVLSFIAEHALGLPKSY